MAEFKIRHALASWVHNGKSHTAFRGQVAEIPDDEAERLLSHNAIIPAADELMRPGIIQDLPASPSDEELIAWLSEANPSEVVMLIADRPEFRPRIEAAVENVALAKGYEAQHLEDVRRAMEGVAPVQHSENNDDIVLDVPGAPTGGQGDMVGGSTSTGADTTDTSGDPGDDDIVVNTPDANATGTSSAVDYAALVTGPADGVAGYISTHPEEANAVLEAENAATDNQPRSAIVLAHRSASGFSNGS